MAELGGNQVLGADASPVLDEKIAASGLLAFRLRDLVADTHPAGRYRYRDVQWDAGKTAIVVCDAWDLHHSQNAVRRLEEFAPRLNQVLIAARQQGVLVIHAPSDCMDSYDGHPARDRAQKARADFESGSGNPPPSWSAQWCLQIPREEASVYPIDQSDGGEDDDPEELAVWAAHLESLGRNPAMPWKKQTEMIEIDAEHDFISSLGDEVWSILETRGIRHVILTGVHLNMCVLGRPFGLRQMVRSGRQVVLMRDMTDTMYNPRSWPFVDHFTGTDLMTGHVERHVCATITSDQLLGGQPFRFAGDTRSRTAEGIWPTPLPERLKDVHAARRHWVRIRIPAQDGGLLSGASPGSTEEAVWLRCVLGIPNEWNNKELKLSLPKDIPIRAVWWNGKELPGDASQGSSVFSIAPSVVDWGTGNLLVLQFDSSSVFRGVPVLTAGDALLKLEGNWQIRLGEDPAFGSIPLPAQFGGAADVVFQP